MSRDNEKAVLIAIGQITDKMDFNDPNSLRYVLNTIKKSDDFLASEYGKRFANKVSRQLRRLTDGKSDDNDKQFRRLEIKTENFFKEMDESLFQVASQQTTRNTQKLVWAVMALTVINTIMIFFIALFMWKLNMV